MRVPPALFSRWWESLLPFTTTLHDRHTLTYGLFPRIWAAARRSTGYWFYIFPIPLHPRELPFPASLVVAGAEFSNFFPQRATRAHPPQEISQTARKHLLTAWSRCSIHGDTGRVLAAFRLVNWSITPSVFSMQVEVRCVVLP